MALILRNGGSQSPDRWLRDPRNNHFVSTVGNVNEETVRKYIQEQEENDKLEDGRK